MVETIRFYRRNLPHWLVADRPYFITMRLHGTLPRSVLTEMAAEREQLDRDGCRTEDAWTEMHRRQFARIEAILHACSSRKT